MVSNRNIEVIRLVEQVRSRVGDRCLLVSQLLGRTAQITGQSVTARQAEIEVLVEASYADEVGSFPPECIPVELSARVFVASGTNYSDAKLTIPLEEVEAWVRVSLGDDLVTYSYERLDERINGRNPLFNRVYTCFVKLARTGPYEVLLAPDNTKWRYTSFIRRMPLLFDQSSHHQMATIAYDDCFVDSSAYRDPRTEADGAWRIAIENELGGQLSPIAQSSIIEGYRQFRVRGAIHSDMQPFRLRVSGSNLEIHFRWKKNVNIFALCVRIPQNAEDFRAPQVDPKSWASRRCAIER